MKSLLISAGTGLPEPALFDNDIGTKILKYDNILYRYVVSSKPARFHHAKPFGAITLCRD